MYALISVNLVCVGDGNTTSVYDMYVLTDVIFRSFSYIKYDLCVSNVC